MDRYDPDIRVADVIDSENDRVEFITSITQVISLERGPLFVPGAHRQIVPPPQAMMSKARIRLNAKKLYGADGYAVKELLKIASVLYRALRSNETKGGDEEEPEATGLSSRAQDVKVRELPSNVCLPGHPCLVYITPDT